MKGILLTHQGMESVSSAEVSELIDQKSELDEGCLTFKVSDYEDLFKLCYRSQSSGKIGLLLLKFSFKEVFADFEKEIKNLDLQGFLDESQSISFRCKKTDEVDFPTPELERQLSSILIGQIKKASNFKPKINLKNPDIPFFAYITKNNFYLGIDFAGFDLSKRSHHIFTHPADTKGTIGFALTRLSDFSTKDTFIDCFSGSGTITIEATLYGSKFPINFYNKDKLHFQKFAKFKDHDFDKFFKKEDKGIKNKKLDVFNVDSSMKYITFAKKNAQIAGMLKNMEFRRMPLEWFDTKFDKNSVDKIVTKMPQSREKNIEKNYKELFYQAEFVLKKKGKMVLIGDKTLIEKYSKEFGFKTERSLSIFSGKEKYDVFVLSKV